MSKKGRDLAAISRRYGERQSDPARAALKLGLADLFVSIISLEQQKELRALTQRNLDLEQHAHNLEEIIRARDEHIANLEQHARNLEKLLQARQEELSAYKQTIFYRICARMKRLKEG